MLIEELERPEGLPSFGANTSKIIKFSAELNEAFQKKGIGWQIVDGIVQNRGEAASETIIQEAEASATEAGLSTTAQELKHALADLSKRPAPDITGAVQHAMAALECVARKYTGESGTLGEIIKKRKDLFPAPVDIATSKLWGFASERGRHLHEGNPMEFAEAQLIVHTAASLCQYLIGKLQKIV